MDGTFFAWFFGIFFFTMYIFCLFTVCALTFQKGRTLLGIVGIFLPFLWLIGAILPAKPGSRYAVSQEIATQQQVQQYSQ
jgi:hypothetical protein